MKSRSSVEERVPASSGGGDGERCGRVGVMSARLRCDGEYVQVNGKAIRIKKCQTSEEAKEQDRTGAGRRRLPKRCRAGERGHARKRRIGRVDR